MRARCKPATSSPVVAVGWIRVTGTAPASTRSTLTLALLVAVAVALSPRAWSWAPSSTYAYVVPSAFAAGWTSETGTPEMLTATSPAVAVLFAWASARAKRR